MLIGGIAVIARGVTRQTDDVDATVWAPGLDVTVAVEHLEASGIVGRIDDLLQFAEISQVLLLRHEPSGTPMEVSLAWLPFEQTALDRAERLELGGASIPVATAEDLIIYKAIAWRERDRIDIERLANLHGPSINRDRIVNVVSQLAAALEEPQRVVELVRLLDSVEG